MPALWTLSCRLPQWSLSVTFCGCRLISPFTDNETEGPRDPSPKMSGLRIDILIIHICAHLIPKLHAPFSPLYTLSQLKAILPTQQWRKTQGKWKPGSPSLMLHRSSSLEVWFIVFSVNSGLGSALIHSSVFLLASRLLFWVCSGKLSSFTSNSLAMRIPKVSWIHAAFS